MPQAMAEELLQHTLAVNNVAADFEAGAEFQNTTDTDLFVRMLTLSAAGTGNDGDNLFGFMEISKSPKRESQVDGSTQPKYRVTFGSTAGAASGVKSADGQTQVYAFAKGQLILRPNEKFFMHANTNNADSVDMMADVNYHF